MMRSFQRCAWYNLTIIMFSFLIPILLQIVSIPINSFAIEGSNYYCFCDRLLHSVLITFFFIPQRLYFMFYDQLINMKLLDSFLYPIYTLRFYMYFVIIILLSTSVLIYRLVSQLTKSDCIAFFPFVM